MILLSDKEITGVHWEFGNAEVCEKGVEPDKMQYYQAVAKAQAKLTAREKDKEWAEWLEQHYESGNELTQVHLVFSGFEWRQLRQGLEE